MMRNKLGLQPNKTKNYESTLASSFAELTKQITRIVGASFYLPRRIACSIEERSIESSRVYPCQG